jgi:hypothetical protein
VQQTVAKLEDVSVAPVGILREAARDQRLETKVDRGPALGMTWQYGDLGEVLADVFAERSSPKHRLTAEQLVHDRAERVDVAAVIDRHAPGLLWRHVCRRTDHGSRGGLKADVFVLAVDQLGDAKVEQLDELGTVGGRYDDDIVGLEIAMDDADCMRGAEAITDLHEHGECAREVDASAGPLAEALAAEQLHDDERRAVLQLDEVGDVDDVAMTDAVDRLRFLKKPQHGVAPARIVRAQQLERDLAAELDVLGPIHVAHAAFAEQLVEPVGTEHLAEMGVGVVAVVRARATHHAVALRVGPAIARVGRLEARAFAIRVRIAGSDRERRMRRPIVWQ